MVNENGRNFFREVVMKRIAAGEEAARRHREWMATDPAGALTWSDEAFEAVAKGEVAQAILERIEKPWQDLKTLVVKEALRRARVPRSTSPVADTLEVYKTAGWAEFANLMLEMEES